ncbi:glycosyltransferase [Streptomyces sporangiiformans]|uniref:glycosyltransferase n=1 Tax=Streptomyces sporangiiformans TaxID=2315329 RepID=UPI001F094A0C|nr:glycosyltransferase [Streptomyces sporangiiformans]
MHDAPASPLAPPRREDVPSVAVLVELMRSGTAGGHVQCWERFAETAARHRAPGTDGPGRGGPGVDLTVYLLGEREGIERLSPWVRIVTLRPVFSTAAVLPADDGTDVSDLAPYHPRLAALLPRHDVWHMTHSFAFTSTAGRLARRAARREARSRAARRPRLVASVHTDVPALAAAHLRHLPDRMPAAVRPAGRVVTEGTADRVSAWLLRRRDRTLGRCERVLVATAAERDELAGTLGEDRVRLLRRGIDRTRFHPDSAARARLAEEYGVPAGLPLVLFVGRLDDSKRVLMLAESLRRMCEEGRAVHAVMAGSGVERDRIAQVLGQHVTLLGSLPQERLARVYAGCDIFACPSRTETIGNAVAEAMASGLAVFLPEGARTTQWLTAPGQDGIVVRRDDVHGWAETLGTLVDRPRQLRAVARRAAETARNEHPSWEQVLAEDLLPVWRGP